MQLTLIRTYYTTSTEGELYINGEFFCNTLERPLKQYDKVCKGCIPEGIYEVEVTMSPRFKKDLPLLKNVPNFEGIRIHGGNKIDDSEGCILVGEYLSKDWIKNSQITLGKLIKLMTNEKDIAIYITNADNQLQK